MTDINHFKFCAFFSGDVAMTRQLRCIARMSRELVETDSFIQLKWIPKFLYFPL
jgi:hypothetical protein